MADSSLNKVLSTVTIAQPASIGPRQAEHQKEGSRKDRRRKSRRLSIEQTLEEEQAIRDGADAEDTHHIDYHA